MLCACQSGVLFEQTFLQAEEEEKNRASFGGMPGGMPGGMGGMPGFGGMPGGMGGMPGMPGGMGGMPGGMGGMPGMPGGMDADMLKDLSVSTESTILLCLHLIKCLGL